MSTVTRAARQNFAVSLRQAIDEKGVSVRSLSRKLNPISPETARSNLMRWLRGAHRPSRTSRRAVAVALGLPADFFDDDEEADTMAPLAADPLSLVTALYGALGEVLDRAAAPQEQRATEKTVR